MEQSPLIRDVRPNRTSRSRRRSRLTLRFELAAPTATAVYGDERVQAGELPAGRYATFLHVGPYNSSDVPDLRAARADVLEWGRRQGIEPRAGLVQVEDGARVPDRRLWGVGAPRPSRRRYLDLPP
jgi:hypothetical protein